MAAASAAATSATQALITIAVGRNDFGLRSSSLSLTMQCQKTNICELRFGPQLVSDGNTNASASAVPSISVIDDPQDQMRWKRVEISMSASWMSLQVSAVWTAIRCDVFRNDLFRLIIDHHCAEL